MCISNKHVISMESGIQVSTLSAESYLSLLRNFCLINTSHWTKCTSPSVAK